MYASEHRAKARAALAGRWGIAVLLGFLAWLLGGSLSGGSLSLEIDEATLEMLNIQLDTSVLLLLTSVASILSLVGIAQFILGGVVRLGYCDCLLKIDAGEEVSVKDLFGHLGNFLNGFLLSLLESIYIFLWCLLFIIPGIIAGYRYAMAPFIMAENPGMTASEAINASKNMMLGHKWRLFCLDMSFIGWNLLALFTFGISTLFVTPYHAQARASFYRELASG